MGFKSHSIDNIFTDRPSVMQYNFLQPEVRELIDYTVQESLKPNPVIRVRRMLRSKNVAAKTNSFWQLPWSDLVLVREAIQEKNMFEVFKILYGLNECQFLNLDVFNAFAAYKWVMENLKEISDIELQELGSDIDQDMKDAGADRLQEFGYSVAVDSLAQGDMLKYNDILKKPYAVVFRKMCLDKVNYEIRKQYQENVSRKNKRNS